MVMASNEQATSKDRLRGELNKVVAIQLGLLTAGRNIPHVLMFFRDGRPSAIVWAGWADLAAKDRVFAACRDLALGLRADGIGLAVDTYVAPACGDLSPADNPEAREAISAIGLLASGEQLMEEFVYGRDDEGRIHLDTCASDDTPALLAVSGCPAAMHHEDTLLSTFAGVLGVRPAETPLDVERVHFAAQSLSKDGCTVLMGNHIDLGSNSDGCCDE